MNWDNKGMVRREHPELLEFLTRSVAAARLPMHEQIDAEDAIERDVVAKGGRLVRMLLPATNKVNQAARRSVACARAMQACLAAERYRMKHGKWPAKLDDLVPAFLAAVPRDPIDDKPMKYAAWAEGKVVYSIGNDRHDDGGDVEKFKDFGYRLWDEAKRRLPAPPPAPPVPPGGPGGPP